MKKTFDDVQRFIDKHSLIYGKIEDSGGDYVFYLNDEKIRDKKRDLLSKEQDDDLENYLSENHYYPQYEEQWYMEHAPEIWDLIENEVQVEKDYANSLIEEINEIVEDIESDDEEIRREYYWDKL